jgi:hypothetical protein
VVSVAVEKSGGASLSYAGDMEERGAARVWEGVAGHFKGGGQLVVLGWPAPSLGPSLYRWIPSVGVQVFE